MADPDAERNAQEDAPDAEHKPPLGTDPMRTPQEEKHRQTVHLDEEKVEEAEREREERRKHETPEERAARIKNA
jgi:hypothetical protein